MAIDPVCGMTVDETAAAGSATHAGTTYYFCSTKCLNDFKADPEARLGRKPAAHGHHPAPAAGAAAAAAVRPAQELAKDPICGMMVDKATALRTERGGRSYYFCSPQCQKTFENPERELKAMRTRVASTPVSAIAT